jgi:hypothetical protein
MRLIGTVSLLVLAGLAATAPSTTLPVQELACVVMNAERMPPATRRSPLDSVSFKVDGGDVKICYGRPSARERVIFGELITYDEIWRTGANEPTMIHTSVPLSIAGIGVEAGSYSLYTVPGESEWQVVLNRSISQWGHERYYTDDVAAAEIDRAEVAAGPTDEYVEMFTISAAEDGGVVYLEWENTRVSVPIARG